MSEPQHVPTYAVRIESSAEGFHAVVARDGWTVHRGAPRAERTAARRDASLFVVMAPEERRILRWDDEAGDSEPEGYHETVRRGTEAVGWVTLQNPLPGADWVSATFHPGPACEPFIPLFQAAMALFRRMRERLEVPDDEAAGDALMAEWNAATDAITALGLMVGDPPRPIGGVNLYQNWRIELYPAGERF